MDGFHMGMNTLQTVQRLGQGNQSVLETRSLLKHTCGPFVGVVVTPEHGHQRLSVNGFLF